MLLARYTRLKILAEPTRARYCLVARNLARCLAGETAVPDDLALSRLTPDALLRFREWSLQRMRPVSFNTERRHLSALFNMAVRNGSMPRNPFAEVPGAPLQKLLPRSLPKDGIGRYIDYLATAHRLDAQGRRVDIFQPQWFWLAVVRTFYFTGMRKRQLLGLVWDDIDFSAKTIRLGTDSSKTRREWFVPLPDGLIPDLLALRKRTIEVRREIAPGAQVFCLPLFSARKRAFKRLRKAMPTDMPRLSAHRIRHTTATILANSVPNLKVVQEQLGHASIATTYIYVHPDLASMRKALEVL